MSVKLSSASDNSGVETFLSNPAFDYPRRPLTGVRFFLVVEDIEQVSAEWFRDTGMKYNVTVGCVCPQEVTGDKLDLLLSAIGLDRQTWDAGPAESKAVALIEQGYKAIYWQDSGNNRRHLFRIGQGHIDAIGKDFEVFYKFMEKPQNRMGATGYHFLRGDFGGEGMTMKQVVEAEVRRTAEGK